MRGTARICEVRFAGADMVADIEVDVDGDVYGIRDHPIPRNVALGDEDLQFIWMTTLADVVAVLDSAPLP